MKTLLMRQYNSMYIPGVAHVGRVDLGVGVGQHQDAGRARANDLRLGVLQLQW